MPARPYTKVAFEAATVDPEIRVLVEGWFDEAIGDVAEGLERAGRFAPPTRRLRAVLAMTELDYLARNWTPGRWGTDLEPMLEVLATSWSGLLTEGTGHRGHRGQAGAASDDRRVIRGVSRNPFWIAEFFVWQRGTRDTLNA